MSNGLGKENAQRTRILELRCSKAPSTRRVFGQLLTKVNPVIVRTCANEESWLEIKKCNNDKKREDQTSRRTKMNIYHQLVQNIYADVVDV